MATFPRAVAFVRAMLQRQSAVAVDECALAEALRSAFPGYWKQSPYWHVWQTLLQLEAEGVVTLATGRGWQLTQSYPETFPVPVYPTRDGNQINLFEGTAA